MDEVTGPGANLPDAAIGLTTLVDGRLDNLHQEAPVVGFRWHPVLGPAGRELNHHSVHVELKLVVGRVTHPHRLRPAPPLERLQRQLCEASFTVHPVHHLELRSIARRAALNETAHPVGLGAQPQGIQRPYGKDGIPNPTVAVVPIALATNLFRQRSRHGRGDGTRRRITQRFQGDGRAHDADAVTIAVTHLRTPVLPPLDRFEVMRLHVRDVLFCGARLLHFVRSEKLQAQVIAHAGAHLDLCAQIMITGYLQGHIAKDAQAGVTTYNRMRTRAGTIDPGFDFTKIEPRYKRD